MAKFNVGDKVRRVSPDNDHAFWNEPDDGVFHGNIYTVKDFGVDSIGLVGCKYRYQTSNFELVEPAAKSFTKADLKDGMRVVYSNGEERIVLFGSLYLTNKNGVVYVGDISEYYDDMTRHQGKHVDFSSLDIVKVYERDGTLLWQREQPKKSTQAEIEYAELQKTIKELQNKADALGKLIK